ncbi:MAG: polyphosphate kinase 1 [Acidimicrobiales bacterium]|jgi:polyphosphate kinase
MATEPLVERAWQPAEPAVEEARADVETFGPARYLNRELSWLEFAARLLDIAGDEALPLLERAKFLAIFSTGLDEFFQVRVAGLKNQLDAGRRGRFPDGRSVLETLEAVRGRVTALVDRQARIFNDSVRPGLSAAGIEIVEGADLGHVDQDRLRRHFERDMFPVLTPLAVDPGHPFPYISNLSLNLAISVEDPVTGESRFARVKVPPSLERFVRIDGERFVPLEQVIAANLNDLFPEMRIGSCHPFRVTRNADMELDDSEDDDLLAAVEFELRRRRFGRAVRLEVGPGMPPELVEFLRHELELGEVDVYASATLLDLGQLWAIAGLDRPDLCLPSFSPRTPPRLMNEAGEPVDIFAVLRERDVLVQHPYDSFASSVEEFISQAAADPDVLAIKQTLYRTSGDAPFVAALARAAEAGKQVAALVELQARFDEQRNIGWARQLEEAGVHVVYGVVGLKTHSKTSLVVRREDEGIRRYCHIGTGNYNSDTARVYEDLGLLTADPVLGEDLTALFNHLTGFSRAVETRSLIVAPARFRAWVLEGIAAEREAGLDGRIAIKANGLTDPVIVDALYEASQAGARVELLIRGICCLRPGIPGLSSTITVKSIVGRYLEHSRIFRFGVPTREVLAASALAREDGPVPPGNPATYFIGSADLMERNLDRRIEAVVPVHDIELCGRLEDILTLDLADDECSWELGADGNWSRVATSAGLCARRRFEELARERSRRRRPADGAF